jgi:predicted nucleotidyltransferase
MSDAPGALLRTIVAKLEAFGIPHMVVGSFASSAHGEPRTTRDLDLVIDPSSEQLERFLEALDLDRYYVDPDVARDALRRRSMFNIVEMATAWKLDLIIRKARPFSIQELQRRQVTQILGVGVATATAEDVIIAKLEWAKQGASDRQLEDVAGILRVRGSDLDVGYIEHWVSELDLGEQWLRARGLQA